MRKSKLLISQLLTLITCSTALHGISYDFTEPKSQEEALYIRRILDFWEEENTALVKSQIESYLKEYPQNSHKDTLLAIMGDIYLEEGDYAKAHDYYASVEEKELKDRVVINQLESLRRENNYKQLIEECQSLLEAKSAHKEEITHLLADSYYNLSLSAEDAIEQKELAMEAKIKFEELKKLSYPHEIEPSLAETYTILGETNAAVELYLALADKKEEDEEHLFRAAELLSETDVDRAIQLYGQIYLKGKKRAPDAAYNRMILLFDEKRYNDLILIKDDLLASLENEKKPLVHFFLGESLFHVDEYDRSIKELEQFISDSEGFTDELHHSFVTLLHAAAEMQDIELYNKYLSEFSSHFPNSEKVILARKDRALLYKELKNYDLAKQDYEDLLGKIDDPKEKNELLYEYAHLLYLQEDYQKARELCCSLLENSPENTLKEPSWQLFLYASTKSSQVNSSLKNELANDIQKALNDPSLFAKEERLKFTYLLAKTQYEIGQFTKPIPLLKEIVDDEIFSSEERASAYLLLANCYKHGHKDDLSFSTYAKKALELGANLSKQEKAQIYLALYNAALRQYHTDNHTTLLVSAADFLYQAKELGISLKDRNQDWLIDFYYKKVHNQLFSLQKVKSSQLMNYAERAKNLLETFQPQPSISFEARAIQLAEIYSYLEKPRALIKLLTELQTLYENHADVHWKKSSETLFFLAKAHQDLGNHKEALRLYRGVDEKATSYQSYITAFSALNMAWLRLDALDITFIDKDDPELLSIATQLKNLYLQKTLDNEPIHLQAALTYIDLQCELANDDDVKRVQLIEKAIDHFYSEEDVLSKEYQAARKLLPEKDQLVNQYIEAFELERDIASLPLLIKEDRKSALVFLEEIKDRHKDLVKASLTNYLSKRLATLKEKIDIHSIALDY